MMPIVQKLLGLRRGEAFPVKLTEYEFHEFTKEHDREMQYINEMVAAIQQDEVSEEGHAQPHRNS